MRSASVSMSKTTTASSRFMNSGLKGLADLAPDELAHRPAPVAGVRGSEPEGRLFREVPGAQVRGHDDDRVTEIHRVPQPVGEPAVLEDLQEQVPDIGVGLFDLVEQEHAVRVPADALGQVPAFLVPHIPRRGTDEPRDGMAFHVLAHVETQERLVGSQQQLGQRAGHLGLPHPRRAQEEEDAAGPERALEPRPARAGSPAPRWPPPRPAPRSVRGVRPRSAAASVLLLPRWNRAGCRSSGPPPRQCPRRVTSGGSPSRASQRCWIRSRLSRSAFSWSWASEARSRSSPASACSLRSRMARIRFRTSENSLEKRLSRSLTREPALVEQVHRLVGQEPVGDVALRLSHRRLDRFRRVADMVVALVALPHPAQDHQRLLVGGRFDDDSLGNGVRGSGRVRYGGGIRAGVVAPMHWIPSRESAGFRMLAASSEPSAEPAPTRVWSSSTKTM